MAHRFAPIKTLALLSGISVPAAILAGCGPGPNTAMPRAPRGMYGARRPAANATAKLAVMGFYTTSHAGPLTALYANPRAVSSFVPFWYGMTANGTLIDKTDPTILSAVRKAGIPVVPLVNDATGTQAFLASKTTRAAAARSIEHLLATMHYRGVNIDFEPPKTSRRAELTEFTTELRDLLPKTDTISMDVVPHSGGAYDWKALSPEVNAFVLMSYDEHSSGTLPGPVAALNWVSSVTSRMLTRVPANKLDMGLALYGYEWPAGSTAATTIPYYAVSAAMQKNGTWNTRYDEMTAKVGSNIYWWENRRSLSEKIALAEKDRLHGVALWSVGYADGKIYRILLQQIGTHR